MSDETKSEEAKSEETAAGAPSFGAAMSELEAILERIEGEEVDVDRLAEELRRAAELLDLCRGKIRRAETEVTQIVQRLDEDQGSSGNDSSSGGDDAPGGSPGSPSEPDDDDIPF